ncbi:MAG: sulfite exporter TauE/SafE family protein [Clostridiales bacterium]|nr:sulfite exporter TauE/SafE family protein [Clostridiales bacterium]
MILFFISFLAFLLAGFGLGGGVLLIPVLTYIMGIDQILAQYLGLISYIPAAIGVLLFNFKNNKTDFYKIIKLIPVGFIGSLIGALVANKINVEFIKKGYGVFLILFGIYMIFNSVFKKII